MAHNEEIIKGLWLPVEVMQDENLKNLTNKVVYSVYLYYTKEGNYKACTLTNEQIAGITGIAVRTIQRAKKEMLDLGYITTNGGIKVIATRFIGGDNLAGVTNRQGDKQAQGGDKQAQGGDKVTPIIKNNKEINKDIYNTYIEGTNKEPVQEVVEDVKKPVRVEYRNNTNTNGGSKSIYTPVGVEKKQTYYQVPKEYIVYHNLEGIEPKTALVVGLQNISNNLTLHTPSEGIESAKRYYYQGLVNAFGKTYTNEQLTACWNKVITKYPISL